MLKIDKSSRGKKAFIWIGALCSLAAFALIIIGVVSSKVAFEFYGLTFIWINAIINCLCSEIRVFKYNDETEKLLENTISKTQVKAKSKSFDFTILISLVICLICSLIFDINIAGNSQFVLGIYVSSAMLFVVMFILKTYFTSKFRRHITE